MSGSDVVALFSLIGFVTGWFDAKSDPITSAVFAGFSAALCGLIVWGALFALRVPL